MNPQFIRIEFIFFDLFRLELEPFALKVNIQKDVEWTYDLCEKIKDQNLTYLYFLSGFKLDFYSIISGKHSIIVTVVQECASDQ